MQTLIPNRWEQHSDGVAVASILEHESCPEGLDFARVRFAQAADYRFPRDSGILFSVIAGTVALRLKDGAALRLAAGTHVYLPPESQGVLVGEPGAELLHACAPNAERARGTQMLVRSDRFLAGCAVPGTSLRWILTPQYLSRRAFLHHDKTLVSPRGEPVSWFHTTMFDAHGLPNNDEGYPVFKMSYNFRTEPNFCYEVHGKARVRMAEHPYAAGAQQVWRDWQTLSGDATYYLNEDVGDAEWGQRNGTKHPARNKHEVQIADGHVSLICMHHPACTGAERHSEGEYSEYGDLQEVLGTPAHTEHLERIQPFDSVVDALSLAEASGQDPRLLPEWAVFQAGRKSQVQVESALLARLCADGHGREEILASWVLPRG